MHLKTSTRRFIAIPAGTAVVFLCAAFGFYLWKVALVVSGYEAKCLCSSVFVSGREPASVLSEDLQPVGPYYPLRFADAEVDYSGRTVKASIGGLAERRAIFRDGLGCTLEAGDTNGQTVSGIIEGAGVHGSANGTWPDGEMVDTANLPNAVDSEKLNRAIEWAFREPDPARLRRTRALVVVYDGRIVAERYAPGFAADTPLPGWSMTKSVFAALCGILIGEGKLSVDSRDLLPMWRNGNDPRRTITLGNLLHMSSGLAFGENYISPLSDVAVMLFGTGDSASLAADKPLVADPGTKWHYSSGTTNIISKIIRDTFGKAQGEYLDFPRRALFNRIGMKSAVVEPDASGTFVGSTFMYATARDWARFGLLYLQEGLWGRERVLPEGWTKYCTTPAPASPGKEYAAHFWLSVPREFRAADRPDPRIPGDAYHTVGYDGQFISVDPIPEACRGAPRADIASYGAWNQEELLTKSADSIR